MTELQILTAVKNHNGCIGFVELLNCGLSEPCHDPNADSKRIKDLIAGGYLSGKAEAYSNIILENKGRVFLQDAYYANENEKQIANDRANESAKKYRQELKVSALSAIISAIVSAVIAFLINAISLQLFP